MGERNDVNNSFQVARNPNYENVYASASYDFTRHVTPVLRLDNLLNESYQEALGYPALVLDPDGDKIEVHLFRSADLPKHWSRLDDFEGSEYRRAPVQVETEAGLVDAWIYVIVDPA